VRGRRREFCSGFSSFLFLELLSVSKKGLFMYGKGTCNFSETWFLCFTIYLPRAHMHTQQIVLFLISPERYESGFSPLFSARMTERTKEKKRKQERRFSVLLFYLRKKKLQG
jgi:hypothetical protein